MSREPEHHHPDTRFELPPELAELVAAARAQPLPPIKTTPEQIHDGWRARRRADRASWLAGGLALAAGLALVLLSPDAPLSSSQSEPAAPEVSARVAAAPTPERVAPATVTPATVEAPELPAPPQLAARVELSPPEPGQPDLVRVLAPLRLEFAEHAGARRVALAPGDGSLVIETPDRAVELRHGVLHVRVAGDATGVSLEAGEAVWIERDGSRTPIERATELALADEKHEPTAGELAAKAERQLASGRRRAAIRTLRALANRYPSAPEASAGLLDLAGLLKAEDRGAAASCAYQLFLERNPTSPMRADVARALGKLEATRCRGLSPR